MTIKKQTAVRIEPELITILRNRLTYLKSDSEIIRFALQYLEIQTR